MIALYKKKKKKSQITQKEAMRISPPLSAFYHLSVNAYSCPTSFYSSSPPSFMNNLLNSLCFHLSAKQMVCFSRECLLGYRLCPRKHERDACLGGWVGGGGGEASRRGDYLISECRDHARLTWGYGKTYMLCKPCEFT